MNPYILEQIKKDKYYEYLKENSFFIKNFRRNNITYNEFKKIIKEKYHLRMSDKIENTINTLDTISNIINTIS